MKIAFTHFYPRPYKYKISKHSGRDMKTLSPNERCKKTKIEKEFVYYGLGFPVILRNVPMIYIRNMWFLNINLNMLQDLVFIILLLFTNKITQDQLKFIRIYGQLYH